MVISEKQVENCRDHEILVCEAILGASHQKIHNSFYMHQVER